MKWPRKKSKNKNYIEKYNVWQIPIKIEKEKVFFYAGRCHTRRLKVLTPSTHPEHLPNFFLVRYKIFSSTDFTITKKSL